METLVALPVFNEVRHVTAVLDEVKKYADSILVVDDGSNDGTSEILASRTDLVDVLTLERNQGYGAALRAVVIDGDVRMIRKVLKICIEQILISNQIIDKGLAGFVKGILHRKTPPGCDLQCRKRTHGDLVEKQLHWDELTFDVAVSRKTLGPIARSISVRKILKPLFSVY